MQSLYLAESVMIVGLPAKNSEYQRKFFYTSSLRQCKKKLFDTSSFIWSKLFKNGPRNICGRQPSKSLK